MVAPPFIRLSAYAVTAILSLPAVTAQAAFDWTSINPSPDLEFQPCYEVYQCARLAVPMDWLSYDSGTNDNRTVAIAITMLPATVPTNDSSYAGPIFTNPGGPGESGISWVMRNGHSVQSVVDTPEERHYDIVGFDPRGVGFTTPAVDCYKDAPLARTYMTSDVRGTFGARTTMDIHMPHAISSLEAFGERCASQDFLPYIGTPSVARDIIAMADKVEELHNGPPRRFKRNVGVKPRVNYMGFSYGTVLGNYLTSMYPDRIGRIIIDGVVDAYDYSTGPRGWTTSLQDTDEIYRLFFEGCFNNPDTCALYRPEDTCAQDIQDRMDAFINSLDERPAPAELPPDVPGPSYIVTGTDIRTVFGVVFYKPNPGEAKFGYIRLAESLDEAMTSNTWDVELLSRMPYYQPRPSLCPPVPPPADEARYAIACLDGEDISGRDLSFYQGWLNDRVSQSDIMGQVLGKIRLTCAGWTVRPSWDYNGPFVTPEADPNVVPGKPATPMLLLSNRYDPVAPLASAHKMSEGHPGSRVVTVEGMAHCTMNSVISQCRDNIVREYMRTGKVPENQETICELDCGPWDPNCVLPGATSSNEAP